MTKLFDALIKGGGEGARMLRDAIDFKSIAAAPAAASSGDTRPEVRVVNARPSAKAIFPFATNRNATEQYRFLRTRIAQDPDQPRLVAVTGGNQQDGKTVTAINLSAILSMKDQARVLLVDADMRRPSVADSLGIPAEPGLLDVLTGGVSLADALVRISRYPSLFVLTGGRTAENGPELLDSPEWRSLCRMAADLFDYVIFDCPPIGPISDYELIQAVVDKSVVVLRPDRTPRPACYQALQAVPLKKLLGVVLNDVKPWPLSRHFGYYQNDAYYSTSGKDRVPKEV